MGGEYGACMGRPTKGRVSGRGSEELLSVAFCGGRDPLLDLWIDNR